jgi:hypothetical protein
LPHLEVEQWGPLIFVRSANAQEKTSVAEMLAPVAAELDSMDEGSAGPKWSEGRWRNLFFLRRRVYDIRCNWK